MDQGEHRCPTCDAVMEPERCALCDERGYAWKGGRCQHCGGTGICWHCPECRYLQEGLQESYRALGKALDAVELKQRGQPA